MSARFSFKLSRRLPPPASPIGSTEVSPREHWPGSSTRTGRIEMSRGAAKPGNEIGNDSAPDLLVDDRVGKLPFTVPRDIILSRVETISQTQGRRESFVASIHLGNPETCMKRHPVTQSSSSCRKLSMVRSGSSQLLDKSSTLQT
jgi:hypothetical protein